MSRFKYVSAADLVRQHESHRRRMFREMGTQLLHDWVASSNLIPCRGDSDFHVCSAIFIAIYQNVVPVWLSHDTERQLDPHGGPPTVRGDATESALVTLIQDLACLLASPASNEGVACAGVL